MKPIIFIPNSEVGPVDERVVRNLAEKYRLDPDFLNLMRAYHGGELENAVIQLASTKMSVCYFLSLYDRNSKLEGAPRPHFEQKSMDTRLVNSIDYVRNYEHQSSLALFDALLPFASTQKDMCLDRCYVDLFCFDYRENQESPGIVLWQAEQAAEAYMDWDQLELEQQFDHQGNVLSVPWSEFLLPVADSFADFCDRIEYRMET